MSTQGILLLDLIGVLFILLALNLVRMRRLYVVYGVVWLLAALIMMTIISIPPLLALVTISVGATFPASAMTLLAFVLVFGMLIIFSVQISTINARQIELAQSIALKEHATEEPAASNPMQETSRDPK
ncbi:MAG: hypothetical protein DCC55_29295 [Chloroflexi bacterium]|nr:MAG: hypothetical protein DCC55_29295 [Chloroflexota bacterium]